MKGLGSFLASSIVFLIIAASVTDGSLDVGGIANNTVGIFIRIAQAGMEEVTENLPGGD